MVTLTLRKLIVREKYKSDTANFPSVCFAKAQGYSYARILADKIAKPTQTLGCIPSKTTAALQYLADATIADQLTQMCLNYLYRLAL